MNITGIQFTTIMDAVQRQCEHDWYFSKKMQELFDAPGGVFYKNNYIVEPTLDFLTEICNDTKRWIWRYAMELDFGKASIPILDDIMIKNSSELYSFMKDYYSGKI